MWEEVKNYSLLWGQKGLNGEFEIETDDLILEIRAVFENENISNEDCLKWIRVWIEGQSNENEASKWVKEFADHAIWVTGLRPSRIEIAKTLWKEYPCLNAMEWNQEREDGGLLLTACEAGSWEAIEWCHEMFSWQIKEHGSYKMNPWHSIMEHREESVFKKACEFFPKWGVDIEGRNIKGETPLFRCFFKEQAQALIDLNANPWVEKEQKISLIGFWAVSGFWDGVFLLADRDPDCLKKKWTFGRWHTIESMSHEFLTFAVNRLVGYESILKELQKRGVSLKEKNRQGKRIHELIRDDRIRALVEQELLSEELDPNKEKREGESGVKRL